MEDLKVEFIDSQPKKLKHKKKDLAAERKRPASNWNIFVSQQYDESNPGYNELMALPGSQRRELISARWKQSKDTFERPENYLMKRDKYQSTMKVSQAKLQAHKASIEKNVRERLSEDMPQSRLSMYSMDEEPIKRSRQRKPKGPDFSRNMAPQPSGPLIPQEAPVIRKRAIIPMRREENNQVIMDRSSG